MTEAPRCSDRCHRMTDRGLCEWCTRRAGAELAALPSLWVALHEALLPSQSHGDGRGTGEVPIGVRVDVLSVLGLAGEPSLSAGAPHAADQTGPAPLLPVLTSWARLAAEERHLTQPAGDFASARQFLVRHLDWMARQPWADDYAAELHEAWETAMTLTRRWESPVEQVGRYCPWCSAGALYQRPGEDAYECQERAGGCGRWMLRDDYDRMVRMRAHFEREAQRAEVAQ